MLSCGDLEAQALPPTQRQDLPHPHRPVRGACGHEQRLRLVDLHLPTPAHRVHHTAQRGRAPHRGPGGEQCPLPTAGSAGRRAEAGHSRDGRYEGALRGDTRKRLERGGRARARPSGGPAPHDKLPPLTPSDKSAGAHKGEGCDPPGVRPTREGATRETAVGKRPQAERAVRRARDRQRGGIPRPSRAPPSLEASHRRGGGGVRLRGSAQRKDRPRGGCVPTARQRGGSQRVRKDEGARMPRAEGESPSAGEPRECEPGDRDGC